jgi:hypothetical protein
MAIANRMCRQTFLYLLLFAFCSACSKTNLVKNPDAETLPFTNEWTNASGKWTQRKKSPLPQQGNAYFFPGVALHGELYQDIDVSRYRWLTDLGLMTARYSAYTRVFPQRPPDQSREIVEFRNADSTILDSFISIACDSTHVWVPITDQRTIPNGTRTIRVRLLSDRFNGSNNDGYHDNIFFSLSLPWWIYVVLLVTVALLIWLMTKIKTKRIKA